VAERVSAIMGNRQGKDYALNYDPYIGQALDEFIEVSEEVSVPDGFQPSEFISMLYSQCIYLRATNQRLQVRRPWHEATVSGLFTIAPSYIHMFQSLVSQETFTAKGMSPTDYQTKINPPPTPVFDYPPVAESVLLSVFETDAQFASTYPTTSAFGVTEGGVPVSVVAGLSKTNVEKTNHKMNDYLGDYSGVDFNELALAAIKISNSLGLLDEDVNPVISDREILKEYLDKDTSMGYFSGTFYEVTENGTLVKIPKPKKKEGADAGMQALDEYISQCLRYLNLEIDEIPDMGPQLESAKAEILRNLTPFF